MTRITVLLFVLVFSTFSTTILAQSGDGVLAKEGSVSDKRYVFYLYDSVSNERIYGALVVLTTQSGVYQDISGNPRGSVQFKLSAEDVTAEIRITAEGYCDQVETRVLTRKPNPQSSDDSAIYIPPCIID